MADNWPTIHAERRALASDLGDLSAEQWRTPSLCQGWSVHDVLAHQVASATLTPPAFLAKFIAAGFNFGKFAQTAVDKIGKDGPAATLAAYKLHETSTKSPPGPKDTWLGETIVHAEDIRRPLGIAHDYPQDALVKVLDFFKGSNTLIGSKDRVAGLTLKATDVEWTHGSGPLVEGPAVSLLMAMTGRKAHLDDLTGDGVETLRGR
ncbi:MAG: hypothetical protein JWO22_749 [Frankiales bacterium]|nr:hypothetical protein [Frankiales bacterium]